MSQVPLYSERPLLTPPRMHPHRDWYRGTSLIRNRPPLGPYSRPMPRALRLPPQRLVTAPG
jgi:hypothetical protein